MTGFTIVRHCTDIEIVVESSVVFWESSKFDGRFGQPVCVKVVSSGEVLPCTEHLLALKPGFYTFVSMFDEKGVQRKTNVAGVIYAHAELSDCGEHALELEIENFPLPGSLRLIGVERDLTSLGIERGRLPHLYKTGKDTCAIFHLLLQLIYLILKLFVYLPPVRNAVFQLPDASIQKCNDFSVCV